jgi:hypothetical protein
MGWERFRERRPEADRRVRHTCSLPATRADSSWLRCCSMKLLAASASRAVISSVAFASWSALFSFDRLSR